MSLSRSSITRRSRFVRRRKSLCHDSGDEVTRAHRDIETIAETYLAEAQKLSHTGSFGWNVSNGGIVWSEETFRIFGYEPATNITIGLVLDRVHPDDRAFVERVINRAATHKEAFDIEHRLQMSDGSVKYLHVVAHALVDEFPDVQFAGAVMDITARKATEQALRRTERRYQDLFQAMAVSFWEVDFTRSRQMLRAVRDTGVVDFRRYFRENPAFVAALMRATRVVDVNDHTVTLFGQGSKEVLLRNIVPFWPDESLQDYVEAVLAAIERNQDFSTETRMRRRDGTIFDAHFTMRYASEDKSKGLAGIIDITARKQAFAKLEASEQRYRHLFQHMPVALWQLNARGVVGLFKRLRSEGVTDLGAYFDAHPGLVQRCMDMLIIEEVNQHTVQMLGGRDPNVFVGTSIARYFPENSPTFRRSMVSRYRGDPNYAAETKLFTSDGRVVDVLYTASRVGPISEPGMSLLGVIDITERKKAEEALRQSESRYQSLFQAMAASFWEVDMSRFNTLLRAVGKKGVALRQHFDENPDFIRELIEAARIVDVNDQTVALFGPGNKQELLETSAIAFWPEESWPVYKEGVLSAVAGEEVFSAETRMRRLDGSLVDVIFTTSNPREYRRKGQVLVGVIDITERKQAFLALEKSEERYRHLFRNTPVALWQLNAQPLVAMLKQLRASGVEDLAAYIDVRPDFLSRVLNAVIVEEVNDYAIQLFGVRDRKEVIGYPTHWMWRESVDTLRRALETRWRGEEWFQETTKLVTRDGRVIDVLYTVARPQMIEGFAISLVSMIDLTDRVRAQEELRRMQADFAHATRISMLGELTASIAHEVNQPLAAIASGGEASLRWLTRPVPDVEEVRELTRRVVADARRASEIIGRIRAMATRRRPEQTLLSLDDVIREALQFLRHEVESRGVAVSHYPAFDPQKVRADRTQLQQVIVNLAVNAMQAMAQAESTRRNISIRTGAHDPATLRCSIEDSGPGIEPHNITRLFDSFFSTKDGGMGMGLRICRSVIEAHGGRIVADNESSQGGARFYFTLPTAATIA
jgi:PAS domain S-box-containing protein